MGVTYRRRNGLLAGLRWGESGALQKGDIDWPRGRIRVERTVSNRGAATEPVKDGEGRYVKASPALLAALRAQVEATDLEGQVKGCTPEQRALFSLPALAGCVATRPSCVQSGSRSWRKRD
jgi:integrase